MSKPGNLKAQESDAMINKSTRCQELSVPWARTDPMLSAILERFKSFDERRLPTRESTHVQKSESDTWCNLNILWDRVCNSEPVDQATSNVVYPNISVNLWGINISYSVCLRHTSHFLEHSKFTFASGFAQWVEFWRRICEQNWGLIKLCYAALIE